MWGLQYWIYMERRIQIDDKQAELEHQCYNLFPERWGNLYREQMLPGLPGSPEEEEIPVTDPSDLDAWYENLDRQRRISGADIAPHENNNILGWADGEGRLV